MVVGGGISKIALASSVKSRPRLRFVYVVRRTSKLLAGTEAAPTAEHGSDFLQPSNNETRK